MCKKLISLVLCLLLIASLPLCVFATEDETTPEPVIPTIRLQINSLKEFLAFAERCRLDSNSFGLSVTLNTDLNLSGSDFQTIPIFCGTFNGNGHTITGLSIRNDGSVQGLFRYLTATATVEDLHIVGSVLPEGSRDFVGGIAGQNAGVIRNCSFYGIVSGSDQVGGIAGINTVSGIIENCTMEGNVHGDHFVGGIAGENLGVIRSCSNLSKVNTTPSQNTVDLTDITIDTLTSSESAGTVTDIGGIAGTSIGVIRDCENHAAVGYRQMGYNIGGIAGSQMGYIADCRNYGSISGRKDVGGIVGQMEPATKISYTIDTLQILKEQLNTMGTLAGQASANAQGGVAEISGHVAAIRVHAQNAMDSVNLIFPEDGSLPDLDSFQAAQNALSSSLSGMQSSASGIVTAAQNVVGGLSRDLQAVTDQVGAMGATLNNASENIGGVVVDISDNDTPEDFLGKVDSCVNYAAVLADLNAGGIVGSVAPENDLDPEEDISISGELSLNFDSELRAVIVDCENQAPVTVHKYNAGGIAGLTALGLIRNCQNTGDLDCANANYVGGIVGQGAGFLRASYAKCRLSGSAYVGGIAGTGSILTDCRALTVLSGTEKVGGILGDTDTWEEIAGNFYLYLDTDPGAIDGISYSGRAQGLNTEDFRKLPAVPDLFHRLKITFLFDDGSQIVRYVLPGSTLPQESIPELPDRIGYHADWVGLDRLDITFDTVVTAVYTPFAGVIGSDATRPDGRPVILAEGAFSSNSALRAENAMATPEPGRRQHLADALRVTLPASTETVTVRYLPPEDTQVDTILVRDASGAWQPVPFTVSDSYLVFQTAPGELTFAALETESLVWLLYAAAGLLLLALIPLVWIRTAKKKKNTPL